jgi:DNA invertase Pin-like site-specific DNA recombinase
MSGELIPVAAYYRMSDDRQENSIERQRFQVEAYARMHGFRIVREYIDLGISGDEITKRKEFQRMLRDAQAGLFQAILCDDKDRFGRYDSIDSGEIIAPLRRKGIFLETVAQGRIDWETFSGRITEAVLQEAKRMEQQAISRRVLSSQLLKAQTGKDTGGRALYGYRWEYDSDGNKKRAPDGRKAEVVHLIFTKYDQGHSLRGVAEELYRRGVASPRGKSRWTAAVIQRILGNRRYTGDFTWGVHASGRCHRFGQDGIKETKRTAQRQIKNQEAEWVIRPQAHEPLIDRNTFERVQVRLRLNQEATTPYREAGNFVLSRLLVCGHCGSSLVGVKVGKNRQYFCWGYKAHGKGFCQRNSIREKIALRAILAKLQNAFLDPENLKMLRAEVARIETERRSEINMKKLQAQADELAHKIDQGTERIPIIPVDLVPELTSKLRQWKKEREQVLREKERAEKESLVDDLEKRIKAAEEALWNLSDAIEDHDPVLLRQVLKEMLVKVVFYWSHEKVGKVTRCRLLRGEIYPQTSEDIYQLSPSADR